MQSIRTRFLATFEANLERSRGVIQEPECPPDDGAWNIKKEVLEYPKVFSADERAIVTSVHCELTPHPLRARFNP